MFSLFKKKNNPVFYFVGQIPKERIDNFILDFIKPVLDKQQFGFYPRDCSFRKLVGGFKQTVHFKKSADNAKDKIVRFDILFSLIDMEHEKWHKDFYKTPASENALFGCSAAHIKNWNRQYMDNVWYDLAAVDNDKLIKTITHNIETIAIPMLNRLSNRQNAFAALRKTSFVTSLILFDYCLMENDKVKAIQVMEDFEIYLAPAYKDQYKGQLEEYERRKNVLNNWV